MALPDASCFMGASNGGSGNVPVTIEPGGVLCICLVGNPAALAHAFDLGIRYANCLTFVTAIPEDCVGDRGSLGGAGAGEGMIVF